MKWRPGRENLQHHHVPLASMGFENFSYLWLLIGGRQFLGFLSCFTAAAFHVILLENRVTYPTPSRGCFLSRPNQTAQVSEVMWPEIFV
jgi:hypothetical protein